MIATLSVDRLRRHGGYTFWTLPSAGPVMTRLRWRFVWSVTTITLCPVALSVFTAVSLFRQQTILADVLRENVASRRAAVELEECLADIVALQNNSIESVAPLHSRVGKHMNSLREVANEPEEDRLAGK